MQLKVTSQLWAGMGWKEWGDLLVRAYPRGSSHEKALTTKSIGSKVLGKATEVC